MLQTCFFLTRTESRTFDNEQAETLCHKTTSESGNDCCGMKAQSEDMGARCTWITNGCVLKEEGCTAIIYPAPPVVTKHKVLWPQWGSWHDLASVLIHMFHLSLLPLIHMCLVTNIWTWMGFTGTGDTGGAGDCSFLQHPIPGCTLQMALRQKIAWGESVFLVFAPYRAE